MEIKLSYHSLAGMITLANVFIVFGLGFGAAYFRYTFNEWNVKLTKGFNDAHKYHGYAMIGIS